MRQWAVWQEGVENLELQRDKTIQIMKKTIHDLKMEIKFLRSKANIQYKHKRHYLNNTIDNTIDRTVKNTIHHPWTILSSI